MGLLLLFIYLKFIVLLAIGYAVLGWKIPTASMVLGVFAALVQFLIAGPTYPEQFLALVCFPLYAGAPILAVLAWKVLRQLFDILRRLFKVLDDKCTIGK